MKPVLGESNMALIRTAFESVAYPVLEKPDFRLFKKVQMRGAREIDERRRIY
jgi:hypothetical protein